MTLRRTPLLRVADAAIVGSGLQPDQHPLLSVLWEAAQNVVFMNGHVKRRAGNGLVVDMGTGDVRGLSQQQDTNGVRWIWASAGASVSRWYGPAADAIYTFPTFRQDETVTAKATFIDFVQYGNWTIMNNGDDDPRVYKQGTGVSVFGNAPKASKFAKKLAYILALGTGEKGTRVQWSSSQNVEDWTPTTANDASGISFDDFDTRIITGAPLGAQIAVFGQDQMGLLSYVSAPYFFGQKTALDGIGVVSKNAVASDGRNVFGVGRAGVWWTDGNTFKYIDEGYLHDYLQNNVNWLQQSKIHAVRNDYTGCFEFFFPMLASLNVNEGWSFDPRTGGWSPIPGVSLKDERRLFQYPLVGALANGQVLYDASDPTADTPLTLRTKPMLLQLQQGSQVEDVHMASRIDEVELLIKAASNVQFRLGSSHEMNGDYDWSEWFDIQADSKTYQIGSLPADGVYWKLDFRNTAVNWSIDLQGFMLFGIVEGTKRGAS